MHSVCSLVRTLVAGVFLLVFASITEGAASPDGGLRLVAEADGKTWSEFMVRDGAIVAREQQNTVTLPPTVVWHLEGDLLENASLFDYSPTFGVYSGHSASDRSKYAIVCTDALEWPSKQLRESILVCAWIVDGRPEVVIPLVTNHRSIKLYAGVYCIELGEAMHRGAPVLLLYSDGKFVTPKWLFPNGNTQRMVELMHFGTIAEVRDSIGSLKNVDQRSRKSSTLLHIAADSGMNEAMEVLLAKGADPDKEFRRSVSPTVRAANNAHADAVSNLMQPGLRKKADVPVDDALRGAILRRHIDVAAEIWRKLPDPSASKYNTELAALAARRNRIDLLEELIGVGEEELVGALPSGVLAHAVVNQHDDLLELLLEAGANVNALEGRPLIHLTASEGSDRALAALLRAGVDPAATDQEGMTALMFAAGRGSPAAVQALLQEGVPIDAAENYGCTALHFAAFGGHAEVVAQLLRHGASAVVKDKEGRTPLDFALDGRAAAVVEELSRAGARLDLSAPNLVQRLEQAILLDCDSLLAKAVEDGWRPGGAIAGSYSAQTIATLSGAARTKSYLESLGVDVNDMEQSRPQDFDTTARPISGGRPADPRSWDEDAPAVSVQVTGWVDEQGRFLFPTMTGAEDSRLARSIIGAIPTWQFEPARKDGQPMPSQLTLAIRFPARESTVYASSEVDVIPVLVERTTLKASEVVKIHHQMEYRTIIRPSTRTYVDSNGTVIVEEEQRYLVPVGVTEFTEGWGAWAAVTVGVNPDGGVDAVETIASSTLDFARRALSEVKAYRFTPGLRGGVPVRTRIAIVVQPDLR